LTNTDTGLCVSRTCRSTGHRPERAGKRGSRFLIPPGGAKAPSPLDWQRPSPLPQRKAGPCPAGGPKPPASARPAPGGCFAPAGSGAGLCVSRIDGPTGHRPARAGKRGAFPVPARTDNRTLTASMAGAIAPATVQRRDQDLPGVQNPRPAPAHAAGVLFQHPDRGGAGCAGVRATPTWGTGDPAGLGSGLQMAHIEAKTLCAQTRRCQCLPRLPSERFC
jgi:hypothetical protein